MITHRFGRHDGFGLSNVLRPEQKLTIQVRHLDDIEVDHFDVYNSTLLRRTTLEAREDKILQDFATNPSSADNENVALLNLHTDARIAERLIGILSFHR